MLSIAAFAPTAFSAPLSAVRTTDVKMVAPKPLGSDDFCYGLPGAIAPLGAFDPLGFTKGADVLEVNRLREAELTHGRVGMLASAGFIVQEKFHPLFSADGGPAIEQIPALPVWIWGVMLAGIGATEQVRIAKGFQKLDPVTQTASQNLRDGYIPGDLGFDQAPPESSEGPCSGVSG